MCRMLLHNIFLYPESTYDYQVFIIQEASKWFSMIPKPQTHGFPILIQIYILSMTIWFAWIIKPINLLSCSSGFPGMHSSLSLKMWPWSYLATKISPIGLLYGLLLWSHLSQKKETISKREGGQRLTSWHREIWSCNKQCQIFLVWYRW